MWLKNRSLIRISSSFGGRDSIAKFLQGLVTQDVLTPVESHAQKTTRQSIALGSLSLNPKGRVISESIIVIPPSNEDVWIDLPSDNVESIASLLTRHKLRQPFTIEKARDLVVSIGESSVDELDFVSGLVALYKDPRWPRGMPNRSIVDRGAVAAMVDPDDFGWYNRQRILAGIPEGSSEITPDQIVPIFYNFDLMNCISFNKGCYTGQELVTRTLRRGIVRKRLFPFKLSEAVSSISKGQYIMYGEEKLGQVITSQSDVGIALCQLPGNPGLNERQSIIDEIQRVDMSKLKLDDGRGIDLMLPKYVDDGVIGHAS
jgi:folate-binding protein YgfZ